MGTTLNLQYKRFVKQVSNGTSRSKYSYNAMQTDLLKALKEKSWRESTASLNTVTTVVNKVSQTDRVVDEETGTITKESTYSAFIDDRYDVYKQGGDASTTQGTFCGYAGCVAYRFELPTNQSSNIQSVDLKFQIARYLRSGLRVCAVLTDAEIPDNDWDVIRGNNANAIVTSHTDAEDVVGVKSWGVLNQQSCSNLLQTKAFEGSITFSSEDFPTLGTSTRYKYLFVYVTIEDYEDYWELYSNTVPRYYSIEGSAQMVGGSCSVTFASSETAQITYAELTSNYVRVDVDQEGNLTDTNYISAFGEIACGWNYQSGIFLDGKCPETLLNFADFPRKDRFQTAGAIHELTSSTPVSYSDIGVFSNKWCKWRQGTSTWITDSRWLPANGVTIKITNQLTSQTPRASSTGCLYPCGLNFSSMLVYVNSSSKGSYENVEIDFASAITLSGHIGLNIWKLANSDSTGLYLNTAACSLLSYQEMFTGSKTTVTATTTLDGSLNNGQTINAKAELVGYMPLATNMNFSRSSSSTYVVNTALTDKVKAGQILLITPRLESYDANLQEQTSVNFQAMVHTFKVF